MRITPNFYMFRDLFKKDMKTDKFTEKGLEALYNHIANVEFREKCEFEIEPKRLAQIYTEWEDVRKACYDLIGEWPEGEGDAKNKLSQQYYCFYYPNGDCDEGMTDGVIVRTIK